MAIDNISDRTRRRLAWTAPLVVAGGVAVAGTLSTASASGASPSLPTRSAAQLLAAVQTHGATAFSGQISETANLGIPSLPGPESSASLSWSTFVSGTHSAKVWVDGPDKQRIALLGELSEADIVHNGSNLWTYTSATNTVTHTTLAGSAKDRKSTAAAPTGTAPTAAEATPAALAAKILKAVSPSTAVSVGSTTTVAGRKAYLLVLRPRDPRSTVREATIAIDATKYIPLRVQIFGSASSPAFSIGFSSISYSPPAASTFVFTTPKGATVSTDPYGLHARPGDHHGSHPSGRPASTPSSRPATSAPQPKPSVLGSGWTSVLELPAGDASALSGSTLHDLTSSVGSSGTRLLHTALLNAVILADGRTFVGAVSPTLLEHIAATTPR